MIDVKFRGKDIDTKEWVYGSYFVHQKINLCICTEKEYEDNKQYLIVQDKVACDWNFKNGIQVVDVDPTTVGQCVELSDIDKNKLYDGDICEYIDTQWGHQYIFKIEYLESRFITRMINEAYGELKDMFHLNKYESIRRIGNLVDNPELFCQEN